jgi:hypothetical protein
MILLEPANKITHPERVRKISGTFDSIWFKRPDSGCVGTVQTECAEFSLNDSFLIAGRGPGETRRVSPALLKRQTGSYASRLPFLLCRPIVTWPWACFSCRDLFEFLVGYFFRDGRLQCGKDAAGGLLDDFERFGQQ